jgi:8-oxo-dGTP pyrophosphatase MutT (NUDIX family)
VSYNKAREYVLLALASEDKEQVMQLLEQAKADEQGFDQVLSELNDKSSAEHATLLAEVAVEVSNLDGPEPHGLYQDENDDADDDDPEDMNTDEADDEDEEQEDDDELEDPEEDSVQVETVAPLTRVSDVDLGDQPDLEQTLSTSDPENPDMATKPVEDEDEENFGDPESDNKGAQPVAKVVLADIDDLDDDDLDDEEDEAMKVRQDAESLPRAACVLIVSDDGMVLAVSRKNDPTDLGLPGGKVDPGEDDETAAARELKEETGLIADRLKKVFVETDSTGYLTTTFFAEVSGEINTKESGVIRWVKPSVLMQGTFAEYNRKLFKRVGIAS